MIVSQKFAPNIRGRFMTKSLKPRKEMKNLFVCYHQRFVYPQITQITQISKPQNSSALIREICG